MATTTYGTPYVSGTDLVANWPAASLTVANSIDAAGYYIGRGINAQTASYTGVLTDAGKTVTMTVATANTFTVPANASVAYPTGTTINILNLGAGACTPTAGAGVTINGTITALATNESASLVKTATNTWSYLVAATPAAPGLSLVTPTSVAGTGVTLSGGAVSFSAATTASINGCFTTTYDNYIIHASLSSSGAVDTNFRMRASGTDNTSSVYTFGRYFIGAGISVAAGSTNNQTGTAMQLGQVNIASSVTLKVASPALTANTIFEITVSGDLLYTVAGRMTVTTPYDGLTIFPASGTLTGTLRIYGLRNS